MNYPLQLSFKLVALAPQIFVRDAAGADICYVKQKMLKLKEAVQVYSDSTRSKLLCEIKANKVIDFSATYNFTDPSGNLFGAVRRKGMRSIFKAHYQVMNGDEVIANIHEENGWIKVLDGIVGGIPIIGAFAGYFFNPSYLATREGDSAPLVRTKKQPALWEGKFSIEKLTDLDESDELRLLMAFLMMLLLERSRG